MNDGLTYLLGSLLGVSIAISYISIKEALWPNRKRISNAYLKMLLCIIPVVNVGYLLYVHFKRHDRF